MIFNSVIFIVFFLITVIGYYALPHRFRWIFLLIQSAWFYMAWNPVFILLMLFSLSVSHISAFFTDKCTQASQRKWALGLGIAVHLLLLGYFKYTNFLADTAGYIFQMLGMAYTPRAFDIILPMGISFFTFQEIGYMVDVYRRDIKPERNFFKFSLFILFFPQLVAGPIERAGSLLPQLFTKKRFEVDNLILGLKYMIFGFFKKVVIADRVAVLVNTVYNTPQNYGGFAFVLATVLFAFQIYCDFGGYSEIARGAALIMGIDLMENFKAPYLSKNIKEFWRRWHVSLSIWFKDYLYIPLGGNRVSRGRKYVNNLVTFAVSGLWHGANWTYVIWGAIHGALQVLTDLFPKSRAGKGHFCLDMLKVAATFTAVCFAWIFFRANSLSDAAYIITHLCTDWGEFDVMNSVGLSFFEILISIGCILFMMAAEIYAYGSDIHQKLNQGRWPLRFLFYFIVTISVFSLGVYYNAGAFIYFQF